MAPHDRPGLPDAPPRAAARRRLLGVLRHGAVAMATLVVVLAAAWWLVPRLATLRPLPSLEDSRRRAAAVQLALYAARAGHGTFLPPAALTIAVHERFLQRSFAASLPFERRFDDGRIVARIDSVAVDVADGTTILTLRGRARAAANPGVYADLLVQGTLGIDDVDFDRGRMLPHLEFTDVRVLDRGKPGIRDWTNPVAAYFTHRSAADWNEFQPPLPLPLQFSTSVELPAVAGDVTLPAVAFPVHLRLQAITALERRLAISVELVADSLWSPTLAGPTGGPWDASPGSRRVAVRDRFLGFLPGGGRGTPGAAPGEDVITRLRTRVLTLSRADSLWAAIRAEEHDLVVVVPGPLLAGIVRATCAGYREGVAVALEPELVERIEETIRTKVLGRSVTAGQVSATIQVRRLEGRLVATGEPDIRLLPPDGLVVELPLRLEGGEGAARFDMEWDPSALGWLVCKGFSARRDLEGRFGRVEHRVAGTMRFAVEDGRIVGRSRLRRDRVRLPLDLTAASWKRVRGVFEEQDHLLRCGMVMDPDSMVVTLSRLGREGVRVRLPGGLPGFELPLLFGSSVVDSTYLVGADVSGIALTVGAAALCVGLDGVVAVRTLEDAMKERPRAPAPRVSAPPSAARRL